MPTVTPIDVGASLVNPSNLQAAIIAFFGVGLVPATLLLLVTWNWGPRVFRKISKLLRDAPTDADLDAKFAKWRWQQASDDEVKGYNDYKDRTGEGAIDFTSWVHRRSSAMASGNDAEVKLYDRYVYYGTKHDIKTTRRQGGRFERAERRAFRRAKKSGKQFNRSAWQDRRMGGSRQSSASEGPEEPPW